MFHETLISRILHDIAGDIGVVTNAGELLAGDFGNDVGKKLLATSVPKLLSKFSLLRFVFAEIKKDEEIAFQEVKELLDNFLKFEKLEYVLANQDVKGVKLFLSSSKILGIIILILSKYNYTDSTVEIDIEKGCFSIKANKVENISEIKKILEDNLSDITKRNVYVYFLKKLLKDNKILIDISSSNNKTVFSIQKN